ncbi:MAG: family N-acetyltransferase, partial [Conexibacter sp.]|nr:family N-acetyltransferase [Conexibacter sp.]
MRVASAIRPATDREVPLAIDVLRRAGFGTQVARLLEFPRRSPDGTILVAEGTAGGVVGVACCAAFATSGWIGALGVA